MKTKAAETETSNSPLALAAISPSTLSSPATLFTVEPVMTSMFGVAAIRSTRYDDIDSDSDSDDHDHLLG